MPVTFTNRDRMRLRDLSISRSMCRSSSVLIMLDLRRRRAVVWDLIVLDQRLDVTQKKWSSWNDHARFLEVGEASATDGACPRPESGERGTRGTARMLPTLASQQLPS